MWRRGADGKLERASLSIFLQEYKKFNRDMFALTFGQQEIPPIMAQKISKKRQRLNYKQYHCSIKRSQNISLLQQMTADSGKAEEMIVTYVHPLILKAHSAASKADNPSWREATRGKFAGEYWKVMKLEIATLEAIDAWSVIDLFYHRVIASTWAFKCKHYPDGLIKKFKARFCARGDKQLKGTDFFNNANNPQDIESLGGEGGLFGRVPDGPLVGAANRSQGQAHDGPGQNQGRPLGDQGLPLERQGQAQAHGSMVQA